MMRSRILNHCHPCFCIIFINFCESGGSCRIECSHTPACMLARVGRAWRKDVAQGWRCPEEQLGRSRAHPGRAETKLRNASWASQLREGWRQQAGQAAIAHNRTKSRAAIIRVCCCNQEEATTQAGPPVPAEACDFRSSECTHTFTGAHAHLQIHTHTHLLLLLLLLARAS